MRGWHNNHSQSTRLAIHDNHSTIEIGLQAKQLLGDPLQAGQGHPWCCLLSFHWLAVGLEAARQ